MKILVVSSFLPYPLFSGGHVRLFNLLKELSVKHEITLVCEKRKNQTPEDIAAVKKVCKEVITVERKKQWSMGVVLQTALSSYPFLLSGHDLPEMKKVLTELLQKRVFDVIHIETFYVFHNVPQTSLQTVLVEHNIEYKVYQRFAQTAPIFLRPLLQVDVEKIKYWEQYFWKKATKVVGVSQIEAQEMRKDAVVVANGVDLKNFAFLPAGRQGKTSNVKRKKKEKTILFLGDFKWIQNRDSVKWIIKDIWPKILASSNQQLATSLKLWIVGKHMPDSLKKLSTDTIVFDEHAPNKTSDIYAKADVLLAPIKVGGGTSYKILEAMASGVPVVTTPLGVEGFKKPKKEIAVIAATSEELAKGVDALLAEPKKYETIRKNAREFIEKNYAWKEIAKVLEEVYNDAVKK